MINVTVVWADGESVEFELEVYCIGQDVTPEQDLQQLKEDIREALQDCGSLVLDAHIIPLVDVRYVSVGVSDD